MRLDLRAGEDFVIHAGFGEDGHGFQGGFGQGEFHVVDVDGTAFAADEEGGDLAKHEADREALEYRVGENDACADDDGEGEGAELPVFAAPVAREVGALPAGCVVLRGEGRCGLVRLGEIACVIDHQNLREGYGRAHRRRMAVDQCRIEMQVGDDEHALALEEERAGPAGREDEAADDNARINALAARHGAEAPTTLAGSADVAHQLTRVLRQALHAVLNRLRAGQVLLASVGATAPFVGLLGTVWGIFNALTGIADQGQVSIGQVSGPVGEALVMTAAGLAVAIPAVLAYNVLGRRIARIEADLEGFARDLRDLVAAQPVLQAGSHPRGGGASAQGSVP